MTQGGLFPQEHLTPNTDKTYACRKCKAKGRTVTWDVQMQAFICSECGQVDGKRTRQFLDEFKKEVR